MNMDPERTEEKVDVETATAELCAIVRAMGELSGRPGMQTVCGFLLNIASQRAFDIEESWHTP